MCIFSPKNCSQINIFHTKSIRKNLLVRIYFLFLSLATFFLFKTETGTRQTIHLSFIKVKHSHHLLLFWCSLWLDSNGSPTPLLRLFITCLESLQSNFLFYSENLLRFLSINRGHFCTQKRLKLRK